MQPVKVRRGKLSRSRRPARELSRESARCKASSRTRTQTRAGSRSKFPAAWMCCANGHRDLASERASGQKIQSPTATKSAPRRDERKEDLARPEKQFRVSPAANREQFRS